MKIGLKNIFFLLFCLLLLQVTTIHAYSADATTTKQANAFVRQIQKKLNGFSPDRAKKLELLIHTKLIEIQNTLIGKTNDASMQRNALYETVRRQLFTDSFETPETIFDDGVGAIWNHAPKGFGILYTPVSTPSIGNLASGTKNPLINGSYFSRKDGTQYHSGLLWSQGVLWSEMVFGDSQITHVVCLDAHQKITFWPNSMYFDGLTDACETAFQAGPLVYSFVDGIREENFSPKNYIGRAHNRTLMVLFENNGSQNLWFVTLIKPATLAEARNVVLRESRFQGEYDTLRIFNLDGGSSVAHRNPDHPELNFGSSKALPVVFEIYK